MLRNTESVPWCPSSTTALPQSNVTSADTIGDSYGVQGKAVFCA